MTDQSNKPTLASLSKRQWMKIGGAAAAVALVASVGVLSHDFYKSNGSATSDTATTFSATDTAASRNNDRNDLNGADADTTYVTVKINGESRVVLGEKDEMTTVKAVLDAGGITLDTDDTVSPKLTDKVDESTVITINRANAELETKETSIAFNTIKKETSSLPKGTEQVETEGEEGVMETTSLVKRAGDKVVSSNVFASYVKKAPVNRVILVGTAEQTTTTTTNNNSGTSDNSGNSGNSGSNNNNSGNSGGSGLGTTVPVGEMQSWAHDFLISSGYTEADFTAAVYIIQRESGWNPYATNASSGAYGLAQALPGSKMASAGADWQTNYQTQFKWFMGYCNGRYGSIQGAYNFWTTHYWY